MNIRKRIKKYFTAKCVLHTALGNQFKYTLLGNQFDNNPSGDGLTAGTNSIRYLRKKLSGSQFDVHR